MSLRELDERRAGRDLDASFEGRDLHAMLEMLLRSEVPHETRLAFIGPLRLSNRQGKVLYRASRRRATAGCVVTTAERRFMTTAGHIGAALGEQVFYRIGSRLKRRKVPVGTVEAVTCPAAQDLLSADSHGVDIAIVDVNASGMGAVDTVTVEDARFISQFQHLRWNGGLTGHREGPTIATLAEARDGGIAHKNTLIAQGGWDGAAQEGDSGAAVYTLDGDLVGHIVGIAGSRRKRVALNAIVQDAETALRYVSSRVGAIQSVSGDRGL